MPLTKAQRAEQRSQSAKKGWETRRAREQQELNEREIKDRLHSRSENATGVAIHPNKERTKMVPFEIWWPKDDESEAEQSKTSRRSPKAVSQRLPPTVVRAASVARVTNQATSGNYTPATDTAASATQSKTIYDLPAELRHEIYRYLLPNTNPRTMYNVPITNFRAILKPPSAASKFRAPGREWKSSMCPILVSPVLQVCRQMRLGALSIMVEEFPFWVDDVIDLGHLLTALGSHGRNNIRDLTFRWLNTEWHSGMARATEAVINGLLTQCPQLSRLQLNGAVYRCNPFHIIDAQVGFYKDLDWDDHHNEVELTYSVDEALKKSLIPHLLKLRGLKHVGFAEHEGAIWDSPHDPTYESWVGEFQRRIKDTIMQPHVREVESSVYDLLDVLQDNTVESHQENSIFGDAKDENKSKKRKHDHTEIVDAPQLLR